MNTSLNLKEIEKRAFRSTYQDGLWDIYYGLIVISMAIYMTRPEKGYSWMNIVMMTGLFGFVYLLFWLAKKYITVPRLGRAVFGEVRKKKNRTMSIVLGIFITGQVILLILTAIGWATSLFSQLNVRFLSGTNERLIVSLVGSLIVCGGMSIIAHFSDFLRGYYIAILMASAVFLMILINQPLYPVLIGILIIIPGIVFLVRFLKQYPLPKDEAQNE